jgi:ATP-dependent Clp protease ATP-binding subunit ClpC
VRVRWEELPELFDESSGRLRSEEFTADAWAALEQAAERAAELGYDRLLSPHCLLALLGETEGLAERLLRLQLPPQVGLVKATELISAAFRLSERGRESPPRLHRDESGETLHALLYSARRTAALWGADRVDTPHLLAALLDDPPQRLAGVLRVEPLSLDLDRLRATSRRFCESPAAPPRARPRTSCPPS